MPAPFTRSDIGKYSLDVLRNKIRCGLPSCPVCNTQPDLFRRHQARPRKFRILCEALVQVVMSFDGNALAARRASLNNRPLRFPASATFETPYWISQDVISKRKH